MSGSVLSLGIDLGGTNIKSVLLEINNDKSTQVLCDSTETSSNNGPDFVTQKIIAIINNLTIKYEIKSVGVAVPGIFSHSDGSIELFPNLPGPWRGYQFKKKIESETGKKISLLNDARAFSLAESVMGAGRGYQTVACLVLGTGVGGGIVIDGKIHGGANNSAGEIAHQIVNDEGPLCGCGSMGCAEAFASAKAISDMAGTETPDEAFQKALSGDTRAIETFNSVGKWLGVALSNINAVLCPDIYIIGGGVAQSGEFLLDIIRRELKKRNHLWSNEIIRVVPAQLGVFAGAIGASLKAASDAGTQLSLISTT